MKLPGDRGGLSMVKKMKISETGSRLVFIPWAATFGFVITTLYEMQKAEGVGLYFALKAGMERGGFDMAVGVTVALALLLLTGLPCLILRHRSLSAVFRFFVCFTAFMPRLSIAYLIHVFASGVRTVSYDRLLFAFQTVIPFGCVLLAAVAAGEKPWKKWYTVCCAAAAAVGAASAVWESEALGAVLTYLLLLVCFDVWERLIKLYPKFAGFSRILFGCLWIRAVYCMLYIRSIY